MRSIVFSATKTFQNHFVFYFFASKRLQFVSLGEVYRFYFFMKLKVIAGIRQLIISSEWSILCLFLFLLFLFHCIIFNFKHRTNIIRPFTRICPFYREIDKIRSSTKLHRADHMKKVDGST